MLADISRRSSDPLELIRGDATRPTFLAQGEQLEKEKGSDAAIAMWMDAAARVAAVARRADTFDEVEINFFDLEAGTVTGRIGAATLVGAAFSPDGQVFALATKTDKDNGRVALYSRDGTVIATEPLEPAPVDILWRPNGELLVFAADRFYRWVNPVQP